jgi:hypothetical protein
MNKETYFLFIGSEDVSMAKTAFSAYKKTFHSRLIGCV